MSSIPSRTAAPMGRRGRVVFAVVTATTAALCGLGSFVTLPSRAIAPTVTWDQSGPDGGGVVTALASDGNGTLVAAGDTMGLLRSTDNGNSWTPANFGVTDTDYAKVAAILYVANAAGSGAGRWFAAVGRGTLGAVLASSDGRNWQRIAGVNAAGKTIPAFIGANADQAALADPRSTGNLLASDGTWLYAGSYRDGVYRCRLAASALDTCADAAGAQVWTSIGLAPAATPDGTATVYRYLRSVALVPGGSRLYVASADLTIDNTTSAVTAQTTSVRYLDAPASATATWSAASAPAGVEELKYIPSTTPSGVQQFLWAAGASGVHRLIAGSRATSTPTFEPVITTGLSPDLKLTTPDATRTGMWSAIDGAATTGGSRIVLSSQFVPEPSSAFTGRRTAFVDVTETTGAPVAGTLTPLDRTTDKSGKPPVNTNVAGTTRPWDLLTARTVGAVGQRQYLGAYVFVAPAAGSTPATLWLAGKQGLYRRDWSSVSVSGNWDAAMNGLVTTFTYNVARDPGTGVLGVGWTDADLLVERTSAGVADSRMCPPFGKDGITAWGLTYQTDGTAWVATGDQTGTTYTLGQLFAGSTSASPCAWTDTHLEVVAGGNLRKAPAFAVSGRGANTIVSAYVSNVGLVRGTGAPTAITWKKLTSSLALRAASPATNAEATKGVALVSLGQVVVLARPKTNSTVSQAWGVDVCAVSMATVSAICHPVQTGGNRLFGQEFNYLAVDPVTPGKVYWSSAGQGVWSFDVSTISTVDGDPITATQESSLVPGGPLTVAPNGPGQLNLVVAPGRPAVVPVGTSLLWRRNLTMGTGFEPFNVAGGNVLDDAIRRSGLPVTGVLVTNKGPAAGTWRIYLTSLGNGAMSGTLSNF